jgi:flagellar biosynthetic protein FliS
MIGARQRMNGPQGYLAVEAVGAVPEEFMKMALDATRNLLLRAETAIRAGDRIEKARALNSASNVVEFMLGVSGTTPGQLSDCLASVYHYALAAILKGNIGDDIDAIAAARLALEQLASTWRTIFPDEGAVSDSGEDALAIGRAERA